MNSKTKTQLLNILNINDPYNYIDTLDVEVDRNFFGWNSSSPNFKLAVDCFTCLEIGSWMGNSAKTISSLINSDGCLICCDSFLGSHEHFIDKTVPVNNYNKPILYEYFLKNTEQVKSKIIPVVLSSSSFLEVCKRKNIKFDFIYIDGDHRSHAVFNDVKDSYEILNKGGIILGDDFTWDTVKDGLNRFCEKNHIQYEVSEGQFIIRA